MCQLIIIQYTRAERDVRVRKCIEDYHGILCEPRIYLKTEQVTNQ